MHDQVMSYVPTWAEYAFPFMHAVLVVAMDNGYQNIAIKLTNAENHRTQLQYQDSLIVKLAIFQFVNNFAGLYYIAFAKKFVEGTCDFGVKGDCMDELAVQMGSVFVWRLMLVGNAKELLIPYFKGFVAKRRENRQLKKSFLQKQLGSIVALGNDYIENGDEMILNAMNKTLKKSKSFFSGEMFSSEDVTKPKKQKKKKRMKDRGAGVDSLASATPSLANPMAMVDSDTRDDEEYTDTDDESDEPFSQKQQILSEMKIGAVRMGSPPPWGFVYDASTLVVTSVRPGGAAEGAGIKAGWKMLEFNGTSITDTAHYKSLVAENNPKESKESDDSESDQEYPPVSLTFDLEPGACVHACVRECVHVGGCGWGPI